MIVAFVQQTQGQKLDFSQSDTLISDTRSAASEVAADPRKRQGSKKGTAVGLKVTLGMFEVSQEITQLVLRPKNKSCILPSIMRNHWRWPSPLTLYHVFFKKSLSKFSAHNNTDGRALHCCIMLQWPI